MSLNQVSIGEPLESEERSPWGWIAFFALALFMILGQLSLYLSRSPSTEILRARVAEQLETRITTEDLPGAMKIPSSVLEKDAKDLQPKIAGDPKATLLYAAIRTEEKVAINPGELAALRYSKDPVEKAAFEIYSNKTLDRVKANALVSQIPPSSFLYKLVAAHALEKAGNSQARRDLGGLGLGPNKVLLFGMLAVALLLGGALILGYVGARATGHLIPKGFALGQLSFPDADRVAIRSAQVFFSFLAVASIIVKVLPRSVQDQFGELIVYPAIIAAIVYLAYQPVRGKLISLRSLGITGESLGKHILWGIGGAMANVPILLVVGLISQPLFRGLPTPEHPVTVELSDASSLLVIIKIALVASVFAPIIEEIMFRGTLFPALSAVLKRPIWAGVITSLIFAMIHPTGIPAWPLLATIGGMSCFLAYQTKSLVPSIVMHAVNNAAVLAFTLMLSR